MIINYIRPAYYNVPDLLAYSSTPKIHLCQKIPMKENGSQHTRCISLKKLLQLLTRTKTTSLKKNKRIKERLRGS